MELDERAAGDAKFALRHTALIANGSFTSEDFDDGIDVDESGDGDLIGRFNHVTANSNFEQGVDLNENGLGDVRVAMADVTAARNSEEGIEFEEEDDVAGGGGIDAELLRVTARANGGAGGDAGLKLREKGDGNLVARLVLAVAVDNRLLTGDDPISGILLPEPPDPAGPCAPTTNAQLERTRPWFPTSLERSSWCSPCRRAKPPSRAPSATARAGRRWPTPSSR